ncbi:UDP-N-acetylmuramyl pentapeptide phosphotransferase/UDP-N-acetylglucosamine-1-phosphate transferase [Pedobacter sp. UYEF25]
MIYYCFLLLSLFVFELLYFKLAAHLNIIDKPNHRSSHTAVTIRGGGVIFTLAALLFFVSHGFQYPFFMLGLVLISVVSFMDDMVTLKNAVRFGIHLLSVFLMFYQWQISTMELYWVPIAAVFTIGTINAYNFMDGINGITGGYSLLAIATLYYINQDLVAFTSKDLLVFIGLSLVVFNFFNFRKHAKCFAGDVGSLSIGLIVVFLIGQLIIYTHNINYSLFLMVYGLDASTTILFRFIRKENIFEAHRSHFYQFLSNEKGWPHLAVTALYMGVQFILNVFILFVVKADLTSALLLLIVCGLLFLMVRFLVEGKERLFKNIGV